MTPQIVLFILLSVALSSGSQVALKKGMMAPEVQAALSAGQAWDILTTVGLSPLVWGGLFCFGLSAVVWLYVLSRLPLSLAYPFVALGILATVLAGSLVFGEAITITKSMGVGCIVFGILLVASA